jgi:hypothetical protein
MLSESCSSSNHGVFYSVALLKQGLQNDRVVDYGTTRTTKNSAVHYYPAKIINKNAWDG